MGKPGVGDKSVVVGFHAVVFGDLAKACGDFFFGNRLKLKALAAGRNRIQNLVGFGRGENKFDEFRRFFNDFEQGVECVFGKLVNFVDDVNFVTALHRRVIAFLADLLGIVDTAIGCRVDFGNVRAGAVYDGLANGVVFRRANARTVRAVERFGKNACGGGFSRAARSDKEIGVSDTTAFNCVFQGADNVFLSDHFVKLLRTPASCDNLKAFCHTGTL